MPECRTQIISKCCRKYANASKLITSVFDIRSLWTNLCHYLSWNTETAKTFLLIWTSLMIVWTFSLHKDLYLLAIEQYIKLTAQLLLANVHIQPALAWIVLKLNYLFHFSFPFKSLFGKLPRSDRVVPRVFRMPKNQQLNLNGA